MKKLIEKIKEYWFKDRFDRGIESLDVKTANTAYQRCKNLLECKELFYRVCNVQIADASYNGATTAGVQVPGILRGNVEEIKEYFISLGYVVEYVKFDMLLINWD